MEGSQAGVRGIAISFAFWNRESRPEWVAAACRLSVRLCEYLVSHWLDGVDVYAVNVPLCAGLLDGSTEIKYAHVHQAHHGCVFKRSGTDQFVFGPVFEDLTKQIDSEEGRGSDTWVLSQRHVTVSPLRANFAGIAGFSGREIKL